MRLRPTHAYPVRNYNFVSVRTHDGRTARLLNLIDEHTCECLLIRAERRWTLARLIEALAEVLVQKRAPEHFCSDNGPDFLPKDLHQ